MKIIAALGSLLSLVLGYQLAQEGAARKPTLYTDGLYGFTMQAPAFDGVKEGSQVVPVMLLAPGANGFSPNVNVLVQEAPATRDQYREQSLEVFKTAGFEVLSQKDLTISGHDAWLTDYQGKQNGRDLRFLALAVFDDKRTLLVTCTATKDGFAALEPRFRACVESFALSR